MSCIASEHIIDIIRNWLAEHIPKWKDFTIQSYGKYLGFMLGPDANLHQWKAPLSKWRDRTGAIAATAAPASISCALYNMRAVGVLMYKAQLLPLPVKSYLAE